MKGIIIYQSKYGATKEYASWISEELAIPYYQTNEVTTADITQSDFLIIGTPVFVGRLLIRKWLRKYRARFAQKKVFLFIVCGNDSQDTVQQQRIIKGLSALKVDTKDIFFIKGRVVISLLSFRDKLLIRMGASLAKDPVKRQSMLYGMNGVDRENIEALITKVEEYSAALVLPVQPIKQI